MQEMAPTSLAYELFQGTEFAVRENLALLGYDVCYRNGRAPFLPPKSYFVPAGLLDVVEALYRHVASTEGGGARLAMYIATREVMTSEWQRLTGAVDTLGVPTGLPAFAGGPS